MSVFRVGAPRQPQAHMAPELGRSHGHAVGHSVPSPGSLGPPFGLGVHAWVAAVLVNDSS